MRWTWIDRIVEFEPDRRLVTVKLVSRAEPHLHHHFAASPERPDFGVVPASLIIEGMAQTAGILCGLARGFREKVVLAKVARAEFEREAVPGQAIRFDATIERIDDQGASTKGTLALLPCVGDDTWVPMGAVDIIFSHVDRNLAGMRFPEANFVFTDHVWTVLRDAGLGDRIPDDALYVRAYQPG